MQSSWSKGKKHTGAQSSGSLIALQSEWLLRKDSGPLVTLVIQLLGPCCHLPALGYHIRRGLHLNQIIMYLDCCPKIKFPSTCPIRSLSNPVSPQEIISHLLHFPEGYHNFQTDSWSPPASTPKRMLAQTPQEPCPDPHARDTNFPKWKEHD